MLSLKSGAESSPLGGRRRSIWGKTAGQRARRRFPSCLGRTIPSQVGKKHEQLIQQLQHLFRRPGDDRLLIFDDNRPLHQLRMLE